MLPLATFPRFEKVAPALCPTCLGWGIVTGWSTVGPEPMDVTSLCPTCAPDAFAANKASGVVVESFESMEGITGDTWHLRKPFPLNRAEK